MRRCVLLTSALYLALVAQGFPAASDLKTLLRHAPPSETGRDSARRLPASRVGVDMATLGNGYVYHTALDSPDSVSLSDVQTVGAVTLHATRAILTAMDAGGGDDPGGVSERGGTNERGGVGESSWSPSPAHHNPQSMMGSAGPGAVFFDVCGLIWLSYSASTARLVHTAAGGLAVGALVVTRASARQMRAEMAALFASVLAAALVGLAFSLIKPLATFGSEVLVIALYAPIALSAGIGARHHVLSSSAIALPASDIGAGSSETTPRMSRQLASSSLTPWILLLGAFELAGAGSAYLPALICASNGASLLIVHMLLPPRRRQLAAGIQLLGALMPMLHVQVRTSPTSPHTHPLHTPLSYYEYYPLPTSSMVMRAQGVAGWLLMVVMPITGRTGNLIPADLVVALLVGLIAALAIGPLLAPVHASGRGRTFARWLLVLSIAPLGIALVRSPFSDATPKRLLVHHVERSIDGVAHDAGLWISAFDVAGLRELRDLPGLGLPALRDPSAQGTHRRGCELDDAHTGCYLSLPYFFPLDGVLVAPDGTRAVYATSIEPRGSDNGGATAVPVRPPTYPAAERLHVEHLRTEQTGEGRFRVSLRLGGSAQMNLVLPEGRILGWSLAEGLPPPRRSPFAPDERIIFAFLTSGGSTRAGSGRRVWELWLEVGGDAPLDFAVYSHHMSSTKTEELELLAERIPTSLRGDWVWSASSLERRTIKMTSG